MRKMLILPTVFLVCLVVLVASSANAQTPSSFTLTNNGWTYGESNLSGFRIQREPGLTTFGPTGSASQIFQNWFWYRSLGDMREFALSNLTSSSSTGENQTTLNFLEPINNGATQNAIAFQVNYTLTGTSSTQANVVVNWSATNKTGSTIPLDVFSYTNPNLGNPGFVEEQNGTLQNFSSTQGQELFTNQTAKSSMTLTAGSSNLSAWQMSDYNTLRNQLIDNNVQNLTDMQSPLDPVDAAGGFQWTYAALAPNQTVSGSLTKAISLTTIPPPAVPDANTLLLSIPGVVSLLLIRRRRK